MSETLRSRIRRLLETYRTCERVMAEYRKPYKNIINDMEQALALPHPLSFEELRDTNVPRCEAVFHPLYDWSPTDWATAFAGECGEACNLVKKLRRGDAVSAEDIGDEIADAIIYADLLAARLGIDLGEAVRRKFNAVSDKRGTDIKLLPERVQ